MAKLTTYIQTGTVPQTLNPFLYFHRNSKMVQGPFHIRNSDQPIRSEPLWSHHRSDSVENEFW